MVGERTGQLPLVLKFPADQSLATFVSTDQVLLAHLQEISAGGSARTCLIGAEGSGKTHLALAVCARAQARGVRAHYLPLAAAQGRVATALESLDAGELIALDGLESVAGDRESEVALFDFHNRAFDRGRAVLYTSSLQPDALPLVLPDLRSRLLQCIRFVLPALDDDGRRQLLRLRARRRGLEIEDAAIEWLLRRVDRDVAGLSSLLDRLDRASLAAQRRLTVPFMRQVLEKATP